MTRPDKQVTAWWTSIVWATVPSTIEWLQRERESAKSIDSPHKNLHRGINSTIVLLSASCIEGFLVECLQSFASRIHLKDTFHNRLSLDYIERVSTATYAKMSGLFRVAVGKSLDELLENQQIHKQVKNLFKFRNGLAHGRSAEYRSYSKNYSGKREFEAHGQYKEVEEYLIKNKLISGNEIGRQDLFSDKIADHFASLVEPYIRCVVSVLPKEQSETMSHLVEVALCEKPKWKNK